MIPSNNLSVIGETGPPIHAELGDTPKGSKRASVLNRPDSAVPEKTDEIIEKEVITLLTDHQINVHDEKRILLFRHFVDALVRVAYIKYGGSRSFVKNVEKLFVNRIISSFEGKRKRSISQEEEVIKTS
mgnify:FL=1